MDDQTGIVIVDHGSKRVQSNQMLEQFARDFASYSQCSIIEPAHMELAEPSVSTAFDRCVQRGAKRVVVCPYFLLPGRHWDKDIPNLARQAATKHDGIQYVVTAPIGLHPMMKQVVAGRIDLCLSHIAGEVDECDSCKGTGRCAFK